MLRPCRRSLLERVLGRGELLQHPLRLVLELRLPLGERLPRVPERDLRLLELRTKLDRNGVLRHRRLEDARRATIAIPVAARPAVAVVPATTFAARTAVTPWPVGGRRRAVRTRRRLVVAARLPAGISPRRAAVGPGLRRTGVAGRRWSRSWSGQARWRTIGRGLLRVALRLPAAPPPAAAPPPISLSLLLAHDQQGTAPGF